MGLMSRLRWLLLCLVGLVSLGLLPGVASAAGCSNEALRTGLSANLPDCRAYEMVSPVEKNDGAVSIFVFHAVWEGSADGNRVAYPSSQAFGDSLTAGSETDFYLASRGAGGWSSHALLPRETENPGFAMSPAIAAFSPDLSSSMLAIGGGTHGQDDPPLVAGEPQNSLNLFVRDNIHDSYQLVDVTPVGVAQSGAQFSGASSDLSRVVFKDSARLTANAPAGGVGSLYEWSGGAVTLVSVLPSGEPDEGELGFDYVSEDGSRVVFSSSDCGVCLREDGTRTVKLGGELFQAVSGDASKVFFSADASRGLTGDTVPGSGRNLYEYDTTGGVVTDLTPASDAEVEASAVVGVSRDGAYVYFVAEGVLAGGATAGEPNLYVWHGGTTGFIATLRHGRVDGDEADWNTQNLARARVTPDGTHLAFDAKESLTGYDNTDVNTGEPDDEVFLYDATAGRLVCASCNPSGARPIGPSRVSSVTDRAQLSEPVEELTLNNGPANGYRARYLSADASRLFFNSFDALVPQDTNGQKDVYEYESGSVRLVSSGSSGEESEFIDASVSGDDVFFVTTQQLLGQDVDRQSDLYDARVDGGFPAPVEPSPCGGEVCRAAPAGAPALGVPGSATFVGAGNLAAPVVVPVVTPKPKPKPKKAKVKRRKRRRAKRGAHGARRGGRGHSTGKRG
jgi:hypothetical protein